MSAAAEAPPTLDEIDAMLVETGAEPMTLGWALDRPLLPREAAAILARHATNPAAVQPGRSRETVHAAERQLRRQASAFAACAAALRAGDATMVPADNPMGSGQDEARELLVDAEELGALLHGDPAAVERIDEEHRDLAALFDRAADACLACAIELQAGRHALHAKDYEAVLLRALKDEEEERARRRRHAAKAEGTGA